MIKKQSDASMQSIGNGFVTSALLFVISLYRRFISPFLPATCRFTPSCSRYAADAIRAHGAVRGTAMALRRIGRCHPFATGGEDPVR